MSIERTNNPCIISSFYSIYNQYPWKHKELENRVSMKKDFGVLLFIILSFYGIAAAQKKANEFVLSGHVAGRDTGLMVLEYRNKSNKNITDTVYLKNGKFLFRGTINEPTMAWLSGEVKSSDVEDVNRSRIFLEPAKMTIWLSENKFKEARMSGSYTQQQWDSLKKLLQPVLKAMKPINMEFTKLKIARFNGDTSKAIENKILEMIIKIKPFRSKINKIFYSFAFGHPASYLSAFILSNLVNIDQLPSDSATRYYYHLNPQIQNSRYGRDIYKDLEAQHIFLENESSIGDRAPLFILKDIQGNLVSLSTFIGKDDVLLDFWASWCPPCRKEIPYLRKVYQQYHKKGLIIISMSWDYNKKDWSNAVSKEQMSRWYNLYLNINEQHNFLSEKYHIASIPQFVLINKKGFIIGRFNNIQTLNRMLSKIFM